MKKLCGFFSTLLSGALVLLACANWTHGTGVLEQGWHPIVLGGGGLSSGIDLPPTGVKFLRTDSNGGYIWDTTNQRWFNVICQTCIPTNVTANALNFGYYPTTGTSQYFNGPVTFGGITKVEGNNSVQALVGAPSDSTVAYLHFSGHLLVSTNVDPANISSVTFTDTLFLSGFMDSTFSCSGNYRNNNNVLAVDPYNKNHVIIATQTCNLGGSSNQTGGFYESFNATSGASSTWSQISSLSIPSPTTPSQAGYIAFDPNGSTSCRVGGGTCASKIYIWTSGSTAGVYATSDGGSSWALMTGSPATAQNLIVNGDPSPANGGGDVLVVDGANMASYGNIWRYRSGSWTKVLANGTFGGVHAVAANPLNGNQLVAGTPSKPVVSNDAGTTWALPATFTLASGDSPWQTWMASRRFLTSAGIAFDPTSNGTFFYAGGQGVWKSSFSTSSITYTAQVKGVENLSPGTGLTVTSAYTPTYGFQDETACTTDIRTNSFSNPQPTCHPLAASRTLLYASGLSAASSNPGFAIAKISQNFAVPDWSGYSNDGFKSDFVPFNTWNVTGVPASSIAANGNDITVTVPSTAGIGSSWSNGSGAFVCTFSSKLPLTGVDVVTGGLSNHGCWRAVSVTATTFTLKCPTAVFGSCGSAWTGYTPASGQTYTFYTPPPTYLASNNGQMTIVNVDDNGSGKVRVQIASVYSSQVGFGNSLTPFCISGVQMTGATSVNGCWVLESWDNANRRGVLLDSTFVGGDSYVTGGTMKSFVNPGGNAAASTPSNFIVLPANNSSIRCTTDAGLTWTELASNSGALPYGDTTVTGGPYSAGATSLTVASATGISTNTNFTVYLSDGRQIWLQATSVAGTTINFTPAVPPGASIPNGAKVSISAGNGLILAAYYTSTIVAADKAAANTFFVVNDQMGLLKWTNCNQPTLVASATLGSSWLAGAAGQQVIKTVPGESGHAFFATGWQGNASTAHPTSGGLWRFCNGDNNSAVTMQQVNGFFDVRQVALGAKKPGSTYPTIWVQGWYDPGNVRANAVYGIWKSTDDANHGNTGPSASCSGGNTWTNVGPWMTGWQTNQVSAMEGDPFVYGVIYTTSTGLFWGYFP